METTSAPRPAEQFQFTGTGSEYFGIWIVNGLLTIITLGIYSAWAKVRRLQYFYRHAEVAGSSFDFHGSPKSIFIGRVLALIMLIAYNYAVRVRSFATVVILVVIVVVMPWLLRNSFRFRLYNTSWRGTRFHFRGGVAQAYRIFLLNGFLTVVTAYVMAPFMHQRLKAYQHDNSWFGRTQCSFHARVGQFFKVYLVLLAPLAAFGAIVAISGVIGDFRAITQAQQHHGHVDPHLVFRAIFIIYGAMVFLLVVVGPIFHALITNLIWNNTRIGEHRIECNMSALRLLWIGISNLVMVLLTLGLFMPWAAVRLARFQLECMRLLPAGNLQEFAAADPEAIGAFGEETATAFDFDISL